MKKLTLVRHAKSSWKHPGLSDYERPLNSRGREDAPMMGQHLAERGLEPDLLVSSPAVRAMATAEAIAEALEYPLEEILEDPQLYLAGTIDWLEVIWGFDDALDHVMCVGHNPGLTDLVNEISPLIVDNVPTCGVIELEFDTETWTQVGHIRAVRAEFDYPKKERKRSA